jgi:hypothetical protein
MNDVSVYARKTNGMHTSMTQRRENVGVDFAGKNHLGHLQRIVVGHAAAFDDCLFTPNFSAN